MKNRRSIYALLMVLTIFLLFPGFAAAHSGRTDGNGGHKDNKNASGLGSYHYHCGGYPAHLHDGGVCPYTGGGSAEPAYTPPVETQAPVKQDSIKIENPPSEMKVGASNELSISIDFIGSDHNYNVKSSDPSVATVTGNKIYGVGEGSTTITLITSNNEESFTLTIKAVPVESIAVDPLVETLPIGENVKLNVVFTPNDVTDKTLIFESTNPDILTVDNEGNVVGIKEGQADVVIKANNDVSMNLPIEIYEVKPDSIVTNIEELLLNITDTEHHQLEVNILPENVSNSEYSMTIDNPQVIKISNDGKVEVVGIGDANIVIETWNGIQKVIPVTISHIPVEKVEMNDEGTPYKKDGSIDLSDEINLDIKCFPEDATYPEVTLTSSDESIIKIVDNKPQILKKGSADITATTKDGASVTKSFTITDKSDSNIAGIGGGVVVVAAASGGYIFYRKKKNKI